MKAVVTGMIATYAVGGVAWDYAQYALGLERLGFDVFYLEDTGLPLAQYKWNQTRSQFDHDPTHGVNFLADSLSRLSPKLGQQWHLRADDNATYGIEARDFAEIVADADIFLNVSGCTILREAYRKSKRKVLIDTDPGRNHFVVYPYWDAKSSSERGSGFRSHDHFLTYALRLGSADCPLELFGLPWKTTRPPVVLDCWSPEPPADTWTTVMTWNNFGHPMEHNGVIYGTKEMEFHHIEALPARLSAKLEVAVNGEAPVERWQKIGWSVVHAHVKSASPDAYRQYIQSSRGELSVAKNVYVATRSGWFSCRTVCYLASGRPAVVQDTGFAQVVPVGDGLFAFCDAAEAEGAIAAIERDYPGHSAAARDLAKQRFDSNKVLSELLTDIGMG